MIQIIDRSDIHKVCVYVPTSAPINTRGVAYELTWLEDVRECIARNGLAIRRNDVAVVRLPRGNVFVKMRRDGSIDWAHGEYQPFEEGVSRSYIDVRPFMTAVEIAECEAIGARCYALAEDYPAEMRSMGIRRD